MRHWLTVAVISLTAGFGSAPDAGVLSPAWLNACGERPACPVQEVQAQRVDTSRSSIVVVLHKAGLLRFLGHEHGILVKDWDAEIRYDPARPELTEVSVTVRVPTLEIDSPEARRLADIDPDGPNEEETAEIRDKMLSADQLDAATHPTITFVSSRVQPRGDRGLRLSGTLSLHGQSREIEVPVTIEPGADGVRVTGEFEIKQRDYGIKPVSIGGVVKVADKLDIKFDVFLTAGR